MAGQMGVSVKTSKSLSFGGSVSITITPGLFVLTTTFNTGVVIFSAGIGEKQIRIIHNDNEGVSFSTTGEYLVVTKSGNVLTVTNNSKVVIPFYLTKICPYQ